MDWIFYSSRREDLRQEYEQKKVLDRKIVDWKKKILSEGIMELIGCSTKQKDLQTRTWKYNTWNWLSDRTCPFLRSPFVFYSSNAGLLWTSGGSLISGVVFTAAGKMQLCNCRVFWRVQHKVLWKGRRMRCFRIGARKCWQMQTCPIWFTSGQLFKTLQQANSFFS